jgi:hypothetical protein
VGRTLPEELADFHTSDEEDDGEDDYGDLIAPINDGSASDAAQVLLLILCTSNNLTLLSVSK